MSQSLGPEEQDQVLGSTIDLLSQELLRVADAKNIATEDEIAQTIEVTPGKVWNSLDAVYGKLVNKGEQIVARGPRGGKVLGSWGGARVVDNPISKETLYVMPDSESVNAVINAPHNDRAVTEAMYARSANPIAAQFDIPSALTSLKSLKGDALIDASGVVHANISRAISQERELIRQQASIQSGLKEAEAAVQMNLLLDQQSGVVPRGEFSQQTENAVRMKQVAEASALRLEASLASTSSRLAELASAESFVKTHIDWKIKQESLNDARTLQREAAFEQKLTMMEMQDERKARDFARSVEWQKEKMGLQQYDRAIETAQKHLNALERQGISLDRADARTQMIIQAGAAARQQKTALLKSTVTPDMLNNYHIVYGTTGDNEKDMLAIVDRRGSDKPFASIVTATRESMYELLASDNSLIRESAIKLIDGHDKLLNSRDPALTGADTTNLPETAITKMVRDVVRRAQGSGSTFLKEATDKKIYPKEEDAAGLRMALLTGDTKEKERARKQIIQDVLNFNLTRIIKDRFSEDVRTWISSETTIGPLKDVIDKVKTKDGKVPLEVFVDTLMSSELKDTAGAPIDDKDKVALFSRAVDVAVAQGTKTILFPAGINQAISDEIKYTANNRGLFAKVLKWLNVGALTAEDPTNPLTPITYQTIRTLEGAQSVGGAVRSLISR